jgi:hypothetical protein
MADDKIRNAFYDLETGAFGYWDGARYEKILPPAPELPEAPAEGTYVLKSVEGSPAWVEEEEPSGE